MKKKKLGFTLAETLITIGLIGIVAALTIPSLMTNIRHRDYTVKLKKFNSTMRQALISAEEEFGPVNDWDQSLEVNDFVKKYLSPFIKISRNGNFYYFSDGTLFRIYRGDCIDFIYDVNGLSKPNKEGYDRFRFLFCGRDNGNIWCPDIGFCAYRHMSQKKENSRSKFLELCRTQPFYCSALLEYDNWSFSKDYPYYK